MTYDIDRQLQGYGIDMKFLPYKHQVAVQDPLETNSLHTTSHGWPPSLDPGSLPV